MGTARATAVANMERDIEASTSRAVAAREEQPRRASALEIMAARLNVTAKSLQNTLMQTVFKNCSEAEFVSMVIVANTYELNPILREIYAFPKKGGGIQAIVGYDGWIKIANTHPQFDGIEFEHIEDEKGQVKAVEGILYRKDRSHPTKKLVYLKEFKRNTDPWNNSPHHMLDVRCFCHTVRIGLGITGIGVEGDEDMLGHNGGPAFDGGEVRAEQARLPDNRTLAEELGDEIPAFDRQTGEVLAEPARDRQTGMTEVDEDTARELDQRQAAQQTLLDIDGQTEGQGETSEEGPAAKQLRLFWDRLEAAQTKQDVVGIEADFLKVRDVFDDDKAVAFDKAVARQMKALPNEVQG